MGLYSIFVIETVHYQPNEKQKVIMNCGYEFIITFKERL